jgi:phosphoribosylamine--glycine ligase
MKVLVIGGGGREHALVWKIGQSRKVKKIYCAPGNAGIAGLATCVPIGAEDIQMLAKFALEKKIDLTVVGPEAPLSLGIVDTFEKSGLKIFGASKAAARIESSKSFAKALMKKYHISTAAGREFTSMTKAEQYVKQRKLPVVVKADGLAAGKGVIICNTHNDVQVALKQMMKDRKYGDAGQKVVIEDYLSGEEASFMVITDGHTIVPLPASQDHKMIFDNDKGPNTGGMGAYSPAPVVDRYMKQRIMAEIMIPTVRAMAAEGCPFKGVLYAGLMIENDSIKVLEYNARFGDPEAQPILMRLKTDIVPVMEAVCEGRVDGSTLEFDDRASVCVVMASGGYPGAYKKGMKINGLKDVQRMKDVVVFHAGTEFDKEDVVATGGRVLGITAIDDSLDNAVLKAYKAVSKITWDQVYYRKDIGHKALNSLSQMPKVGIVMGSDSDMEVMEAAVGVFKMFGIPFEITVASAHRSPHRAAEYAMSARKRGLKVIIAGAGHAAHLAGVLAAHTTLPVIGVPIDSSCLQGLDALLSTAQMPPGVPVATMAIGTSGAKNAGILSVQILSGSDIELEKKMEAYKKDMAEQVEKKSKKLNAY